jgi:adenylate cyclase
VTAIAPTVSRAPVSAARHAVVRRIETHFATCMVAANLGGGAWVFLFLGFLLPHPEKFSDGNVIALIAYMVFSVAAGCTVSARKFAPIRDWVLSDEPLDEMQRTYVVRQPLRQTVINFTIWMGSEAVFIPVNVKYGVVNVTTVAVTILLGAVTTCGLTYLMAERLLRPINELSFASRVPTDPFVPGVKSRLMLAWGIGSAVPLFGVFLMAIENASHEVSPVGLAILGLDGLFSGAVAMAFAAKSVSEPVGSVTEAMRDVEAGRLDVRVPVYDGSQIGRLQSGLNTMVEGLRERQQLRDLFGRQVGEDVARHALERGVRLGGEQVDAAVLFVDVIGSTEMAATRPATEVVAALNAFFAVVVDVVDRTGGIVNKFEGDAALCVFGAPVPREDAADCALLAARLLRERLADVHGLSAAVGVSAGPMVAGNIGTRERFEYTVIGDAVNEAARLTELAKTRPGRLLVSSSVVERASRGERLRWCDDGDVVLRGRGAATHLAVPR